MSRYTVDALKKDLARLKQVGKNPIGFRPKNTAEDTERKEIKKRLRASGFDVEVQSHVWVSLREEDE